ncbi:hypothetical protein [Burkholderia territorii]|nr:hypothetical protein [Burkholderia territorii]
MSESAVRASIKDLEEAGHIETIKVPGKVRVYRVLLSVEAKA